MWLGWRMWHVNWHEWYGHAPEFYFPVWRTSHSSLFYSLVDMQQHPVINLIVLLQLSLDFFKLFCSTEFCYLMARTSPHPYWTLGDHFETHTGVKSGNHLRVGQKGTASQPVLQQQETHLCTFKCFSLVSTIFLYLGTSVCLSSFLWLAMCSWCMIAGLYCCSSGDRKLWWICFNRILYRSCKCIGMDW